MSPFQSRCTNSFHSISQLRVEGCLVFICCYDGQVAPEMLCTEPWLSCLAKQCCLCCWWGREGPAAPAQGSLHSASSSGVLTDTCGCWLCTAWVCTALAGAALLMDAFCKYESPLLQKEHFWPPCGTPAPRQDLGAGWTGLPTFICLGTCSGNSCSFGLCDHSWQESWAFPSAVAGHTHPAAPSCTQPSPPDPISMCPVQNP